MRGRRRKGALVAFVAVGCGLVAVGISTKNGGLMGAGVVFIIIGAADAVRRRKSGDEDKQE